MIVPLGKATLATAYITLISCVCIIATLRSQPISTVEETLPTGSGSPEAVACDLVRAYIAKDAELFHERRCKSACENAFDASNAYDSLLNYAPISLGDGSQTSADSLNELRITKTSLRPDSPTAVDPHWGGQFNLKRAELFFDYGAIEAKFVYVVAQDSSNHEYQFVVEAMHYPKTVNDVLSDPEPSGIWRGRLVSVK